MTAAKPKADKPAKETKPKAAKAEAVKADVSPVLSDETVAGAAGAEARDESLDNAQAPGSAPVGAALNPPKEVKPKAAAKTAAAKTDAPGVPTPAMSAPVASKEQPVLFPRSFAKTTLALFEKTFANGRVAERDIKEYKEIVAFLDAEVRVKKTKEQVKAEKEARRA